MYVTKNCYNFSCILSIQIFVHFLNVRFTLCLFQEIDYDITLEESGIVLESETGNEDSLAEGIAKGKQAYSLLDNPETREEFINQLLEVSR